MAASATWANATTATTGTGVNVTVTKPSGMSTGDAVFVVVVAYDNASVTATPNGWTPTNTLTAVRESTTEVINIFGFVRKIDGSEGASFQTDLSASVYRGAVAIPITGLGSTVYDTAGSTNGRASSQTLAGLTTANANELLIGVKAGYNQAVTVDPSNWTARLTYDTVIEFYDRTVAGAGAVSSEALTVGATEGWASLAAAFIPAAAGGTTYPVHMLSSRTPFTTNYRGSL